MLSTPGMSCSITRICSVNISDALDIADVKAPVAKEAFVRCSAREVHLTFLKLELMEGLDDVECGEHRCAVRLVHQIL